MKKAISMILLTINIFLHFTLVATCDDYITGFAEFEQLVFDIILEYDGSMLAGSSAINMPTRRLIVKTSDNKPLVETYGAVAKAEGYNGLHVLQYETISETDIAYKKFVNADIEYVEYDFYFDALSDESQDAQENIILSPQPLSWNSEVAEVGRAFEFIETQNITLSKTKVAIIDSGVYAEHDFFNNAANKGKLKDSKYYFQAPTGDEFPSNVDHMYHGTHVAGILCDNVMNCVELYPYKCFTYLDITNYFSVCLAFERALLDGANVINMSIASPQKDSKNNHITLLNYIENAVNNKGVVVVVAAGNERTNADNWYPSSCKSAITVSATDKLNNPDISYSNYGSCVDISAPGTKINSTVPRYYTVIEHDVEAGKIYSEEPQPLYKEVSGTSMATPLVSAAAAFILSIDPTLTPAEVEKIIKETAYIPDNWEQYCGNKNYGSGIVNFYNIAKYMVFENERESQMPEIKLTSDNKFEISVPDGIKARIYYTLDGSLPTIDNHLTYSEPLMLGNTYASKITAVCHEDGKLVGEPVSYDIITYKTKTIFYKSTGTLKSNVGCKNAYWSSYNSDIAEVDNQGKITANSVGNTKITCRLQTGERIIWKVNVIYNPIQAFFVLFFFGFLWI